MGEAYSARYNEAERKDHSQRAADRILAKARELGLQTNSSSADIARAIQNTVEYGRDAIAGSLYFKTDDSAWSCDANVSVMLNSHESGQFGVCAETTCGWSSSLRCVPMALDAIGNYRKAIDFAAFVEAYLR